MYKLLRIAAALALACAAPLTHAGGIPVIDVANLMQTIQQVINDVTKI
jgi:type IV secretion system protein VirB5